MPSPAMATMWPSCLQALDVRALVLRAGLRRRTSSMPSDFATASAVVRLSPVSMTMRMPSACSCADGFGRGCFDGIGDGESTRRACRRWRRNNRAPARSGWRPSAQSAGASAISVRLPTMTFIAVHRRADTLSR